MKKCVILFALLLVAICLFKFNSSDNVDANDKLTPKELASISENEGIAKN
ncbi:hypothetical protein MTsPCn9_24490 [Croceitalea sp. MTPC9]|nr:hypothetical protein MTsPCn6_19050 [Croceitalea sp. MTPC6]GMN17511.1 hypothetical protein MTsPCn9_24490 [Croceitalea sp. MTPC9]